MRKIFIVLAALCAMIASPAFAQQSAAERPEIGRIKNVTPGGIEVIRSKENLPASAGFRLREGDIVVTKRGQTAGITFIDNTRISVAPGTRMIISRYLFDRGNGSGESLMEVERGAVGVDSGRLSGTGNMRFKTPSSTLGVRGTTFVIEVG